MNENLIGVEYTSENKIKQLWNELLSCSSSCDGVNKDKSKGIIPRCLFLETDGRNLELEGCVIVGLNPGPSSIFERNNYLEMIKDNTIENLFKENPKHKYYTSLRKFTKSAELDGVILWTELVKCECSAKNNAEGIPIQTYRFCVEKHLKKEVEALNEDWVILAVGRETHKALSYLYPKKSIIGIPHPTASHGQFAKLFEGDNFKENIKEEIRKARSAKGNSVWLKGE